MSIASLTAQELIGDTNGLPFGWKRIQDKFLGPGGLEFLELYEVYKHETENLRVASLLSDKQLNMNSPHTVRTYFTHAVCGSEPEGDEMWNCYVEFLDLISVMLKIDFTMGVDIMALRANIYIPSEYKKKFAHLVKRLSKYGGRLRFRITKNR